MVGRMRHPGLNFDGELWVAGGNGGSGTLNSWSSSDGSAWTKVAVKDNETSRSGMERGVMGNRFYLIGGYVGNNTYKDDVLKYGPSLPQYYNYFSCIILKSLQNNPEKFCSHI